ncbi:MAG: DUF721 domain-containing protein [Elusimicrobia bacterium]|nr:DUF721 domain-containing protein [Elusimicrobiota bacterium]
MMKAGGTGLGRWVQAGDAVKQWSRAARLDGDRMLILNQVWEREAGHLARHWALDGVRRGVLYVRTSSPAAAQELHLRAPALKRALNKYFRQAWIREIKTSRT